MPTYNNHENYKWRETQPGTWQRDADEAEVFYSTLVKLFAGSGRMHFAITGHVSITVSVPEGASPETSSRNLDKSLRVAWARLRHQLPTLASRVHYVVDEAKWKKTYQTIADDVSRSAWLDETFKIISTNQTGAEWANSDPPAPEMATLFVVVPPTSTSSPSEIRRDLVLRSPHDITDGIGTLQLFNILVHRISDTLDQQLDLPTFDNSEISRLSPPYRTAAAVPEQPTPKQSQKIAALRVPPQPVPSSIQPIGIPFQSGPPLPGKHQRVSHTIPASQTKKLLTALKSLGATPTHAFHAAIPMAVRDMYVQANPPSPTGEQAKQVQYVNYILRNERPSCVPPYNSPSHSASVYHSVSGAKLAVIMDRSIPDSNSERNQEFLRILEEIKSFYLDVKDDKDHFALAPYIWENSIPEINYPSSSDSGSWEGLNPVPKPNEKPSVSISSMGLIDRLIDSQVGNVSVSQPWVTGEELGTGLGLFLGTFRGELELSAAYNDAWHGKEEVQGFLSRCEEIVFGYVG
ncbi:hypothetical protein QBC44DRAFT_297650 [Cladorrhinum sp. PSN332]|nr:hypothetical protein QBC44DRAFT_297650 [Cladorrhinum sp. PSN332]